MPLKAKDKKGKQELLSAGIDYARRPLPPTEPCDARPTPRRELPVVSAHHSFEVWDEDSYAEMEWGKTGAETLFEDKDGRCFLPAEMAARVVRWVRPRDLISQKKGESDEGVEGLQQGGKGTAGGVEKDKTSGGADKGKAKTPKGKAPMSEPVVLEDAATDEEGNPLPRVVVSASTVAVPGENRDGRDNGKPNAAGGPRQTPGSTSGTNASNGIMPAQGFKSGWSREQRQQIASLLRKGAHQQQQQQTPPQNSTHANEISTGGKETPPEEAVEGDVADGNNVSPEGGGSGVDLDFLSDDNIATLGAPSGDDVDPAMTAIFKVAQQLSPTLSRTGCPLLWEAIYPKTSDEVPCYNPYGRYAIKLFAAGRWRKVEVDDCIPLDAARSPVIAASEDPLELWPLLLSKALYKLYRLGGYELAQEVATTTSGLSHASTPSSTMKGSVATGENNEEGTTHEAMDEADHARFVAFVLHSLAGWIPSVTTRLSAEAALSEGTPGLTPDDLYLPALPPVDVEEEAARERLEERKRRQALFLHKKRRPRKVERKVISEEERAEVDSARLKKMRLVTQKVSQGTRRREVYVVCMPGKPAYPVLAVCPQVSLENQNANACQKGNPEQGLVTPVTADVGISNSSSHQNAPPPSSSAPLTAPSTPVETEAAPPPSATTAHTGEEKNQPLGFLLKWETPKTSQQTPAVTSDSEVPLGGQQHEGVGDTGGEEQENRAMYGSGARRRGHGKELSAEAAGATSSSLSKPAFLWLSPREIKLAGGMVVRALTKIDTSASADVQYHWKLVSRNENAETPNAGNGKAASSKDAKTKVKAKAAGKSKDNTGTKGKAAKGEPGRASGGTLSQEDPTAEIAVTEAERSPPGPVQVGGAAVPKGLDGILARDPGSPPAIFLLMTPSPRPEKKGAALPQAQNEEIPELDGALSEPPPAGSENTESDENTETKENNDNPPEVAVEENEGNADVDENNVGPEEGDEDNASPGGADGEEEEEQEAEEEEAEILMCLWVDMPGMDGVGGASSHSSSEISDVHATVVLQEVLPGGLYARGDFSRPVPGGRVVMCARHDPQRNGLPFTVTSAKVQLTKGGVPKVFRVLLQPGVGCCVGFCSTHDIETGDAGQVWAEAGYSQVTETGKYESARPGEWKLLLRRAFRVAAESDSIDQSEGLMETSVSKTPHGSDDGDSTSTVALAGDVGNPVDKPLEEGLSLLPSSKEYCFVKAILHLPDECSRPSVRLAFVDEDTSLEMVQPTLHTNAVPLKPNKRGYSLLAVACNRAKAIPKGAWRLQLLSDRPLLPLDSSASDRGDVADSSSGADKRVSSAGETGEARQEGSTTAVSCQERVVYGGVYEPNKYLLFFRDVLTCASPLPFAVRLRCSRPGTCLRLKFLDAATGETLRDLRGKHVLQAFTVTPPPAPENDPSSPPAPQAPAKGGSKGKDAVEKTVIPAPGKMIVEAALDWRNMKVPPHLESKLPHYFQPTPEDLPHYCPPLSKATSRTSPSEHPEEHGNAVEEEARGRGGSRSSYTEASSPPTSSTIVSAATETASSSAAPRSADPEDVTTGLSGSDATPTPVRSSETTGEPLRWWLEIVGAGEVDMAHDTARVDRENVEVESWETAEPGRAARAALLWTQRQASKVARLGSGDNMSPPAPSSAGTNTSADSANAAVGANPSPGAQGYEDWIKARAAAVGVPVALETERQGRRLVLSTTPATDTAMPAPSSGSSSSAKLPSSARPTSLPSCPPSPAVLIGEEELKQRAEEREVLRQATAEFENKWEEDRIKTVEAGREQMAMQLKFIRGREEQIKEARLPFLRDRDTIVLDMIAKAEARKEALEEERAALEPPSKGAKGKQSKGKPGKK